MKKIVLLAFFVAFLSTALSLCGVDLLGSQIAYASPYTDIDVETAYNMITNDSYPDLVVLDVRTEAEYDGGHIHDAVWIPHTELEARIDELAGHENHEIIVYCEIGGRSVTASGILDFYNFTKVYNMLGGISAWQSAGHSVWTPPPVEEAPFWKQWWFLTMVIAGIVVLAGVVYFLKKRKPPTPTAPAVDYGFAS